MTDRPMHVFCQQVVGTNHFGDLFCRKKAVGVHSQDPKKSLCREHLETARSEGEAHAR